MLLISILITSEDVQPEGLPQSIAENIRSFKDAFPGLEFRLFDNDQIRESIANAFGREVLDAYDALRPFAFKADLARLCLLSIFGGVYADLSCYFVQAWQPYERELEQEKPRLWVFRDFLSVSPWDTSQSVIGAPVGHKALIKGVELICANVKDRYYGPAMLCPTGPTCFGKAIALTCETEDLIVGDSFALGADQLPGLVAQRRHSFVMGGRVIAVKRKRYASLEEFGVTTGNNYVSLWHERQVYND